MAKKKSAPRKKKSSAKQKKSKGQSNVGLLLVVLVLVGGLVLYGLYQTSEFTNSPVNYTQESTGKKETGKSQTGQNSGTSATKPNDQKVFAPDDLNARDEITEEVSTNKNLPTYRSNDTHYYTQSFDFAWPAYSDQDQIVEHEFFALSYDERNEQAKWLAYSLQGKNLNLSKFAVKDNFRQDPSVASGSSTAKDFVKTTYVPGQLAPAQDFVWTEKGLDDSYLMSNVSPQHPGLNSGLWKDLEVKVRAWAKKNKRVFVVTGPISGKRSKKIGKNKVSIPSHFYKVILDMEAPEVKSIGFVFENKELTGSLFSYAVTVDEVEQLTGLDFFPNIPDDLEDAIEGSLQLNEWR